jgi:hypothetical protein
MPMHIATIRRMLAEFIELRMAEQGAKYQDADLLGDEERCPMVNPACPEDLCVLPVGHPGAEQKIHILGTDNYEWATKYKDFPMAALGHTDSELINLGCIEQQRLGIR